MMTLWARKAASILAIFIAVSPKSVLLFEYSYFSGSNTRKLSEQLKEEFSITVVDGKEAEKPVKDLKGFFKKIKFWLFVAKFQYLISTHGSNKVSKKQTLIELWHGIPLKAMGAMETTNEDSVDGRFTMDYLITTSKLHSTLMNACIHVEYYKHRILGSPRNDYLFREPDHLMERLSGKSGFNKTILYMPTFKQGYLGRTEGAFDKDLFNFGDFEQERAFLRYLEEHNYLLIVKLHAMEEALVLEKFNKINSDHIFILRSETLERNETDIYEMLPEVDLLITDYSSIYFDFLLLDKPMIFVNHDLNEYRGKRGLVLEPYEHWTPGHKVQSYPMLAEAVDRSFAEDPFAEKRNEMRAVFHRHQDGLSSERIADFIKELESA